MPVDPELAHHRAVVAANTRWSKPGAREAHAEKISRSKIARHERLVDPDGALDPAERTRLAENSLKAEMSRLALIRARKRRQATEKAS